MRANSCVLDEDVADPVSGGLAGVDGVLERFVDVLPADHDHGIDAIVLEKARAGGACDVVSLVLDCLDREDLLRRAPEPLQPAEQRRELCGRAYEQPAELERLSRRPLDSVEA